MNFLADTEGRASSELHGRRVIDTRSRDGARYIGVLQPLENRTENAPVGPAQKEAFKKAFVSTLKGEAEGALTPYLFYDPPKVSPELEQEIWGADRPVKVGARAWDQHISESTDANKSGAPTNTYGFANGDVEVLHTALDAGLIKRLPHAPISYFAYGLGESIAVTNKDCLLLDAVVEGGRNISRTVSVDLNDRYVKNGMQIFHDRYNRKSEGISGDFMEGVLPILPEDDSVALVGIFGGPFANAPNIKGENSPKQNAVRYLSKITEIHGPGTHVVMTVETKPKGKRLTAEFVESVLKEYARTKSFEAFLLSAFPRAVYDGVIHQPYNVFENWRMVTDFDDSLNAVRLIAEAKKKHIIRMDDGSVEVSKGDQIVPILSNKWDEDEIQSIFNVAGSTEFRMYGKGSRKLVYAVMGKAKQLDLD